MKKLTLTITAALLAALLLGGCSFARQIGEGIMGATGGQAEAEDSGIHEGALGNRMRTYFFDFTVLTATEAESYGDYTPGAGSKLVVVKIKSTNTYGESIVMLDYDYQLQWGDWNDPEDDDKYADALLALTEDCAPEEVELAADASMTYDYVYEVPADAGGFEMCYLEVFWNEDEETETTGDIYYVALGL